MRKFLRITLISVLLALCSVLLSNGHVYAYPVPELPPGNLLENPWFRSETNPTLPGFSEWVVIPNGPAAWGLSQKESNPSPDIVIAGKCGFQPIYCGTAARWANESSGGTTNTYPGVDVYVYQVVAADPVDRRLTWSMYWVNHRLEVGEVLIYGSDSSAGPWELVWTPLIIFQNVNPGPCCTPGHNGIPWFETGTLTSTLEIGYDFYKVQLHARYPQSNSGQGDVGIKITGVYFSAIYTDDPPAPATPVYIVNPTISPTPPGVFTMTPNPSPTSPPDETETPAPTGTQATPTASPTPTRTPRATRTPELFLFSKQAPRVFGSFLKLP